MTVKTSCVDEAALVGYVYEDLESPDAAAVKAHVAACATCADAARALQSTREALQSWTPPEVALGFQVVAGTPPEGVVTKGPARWWRQPLPAWAQVAAAIVLFSAGAALGVLRGSNVTPVASTPVVSATAQPVSAADLAALEARLRAEMRASDEVAVKTVEARGAGDDAILEQVRALIQESERRQQQELTLRTAELARDVNAQRRGDLARIERTFGQMEGTTGVQVEQQRQLLNYLMRVSQRQPQ